LVNFVNINLHASGKTYWLR